MASFGDTLSNREMKFKHCFKVGSTPDLSDLPVCYFNQKTRFFFDVYDEAFKRTKAYIEQLRLAKGRYVDLRPFVSLLRTIMRDAIPFAPTMGHREDHPIVSSKVVWCPCQLIIDGCANKYNKVLVDKDPMTMKKLYHHCTKYGNEQDCGLHRVIGVFVGNMKRLCENHYKIHSNSMVCADPVYSSEAESIKWIRFVITSPTVSQQKPIYYYKSSSGWNDTVLWTEPTERYRDAKTDEIPWSHPSPPVNKCTNTVQNCVWVRHKHVMKQEPDVYYFSRLDSEDLDIIWTTPAEQWRDATVNERLLITPVRPGCTSPIDSINLHEQRIIDTHKKIMI